MTPKWNCPTLDLNLSSAGIVKNFLDRPYNSNSDLVGDPNKPQEGSRKTSFAFVSDRSGCWQAPEPSWKERKKKKKKKKKKLTPTKYSPHHCLTIGFYRIKKYCSYQKLSRFFCDFLPAPIDRQIDVRDDRYIDRGFTECEKTGDLIFPKVFDIHQRRTLHMKDNRL